MSVYHEPLSFMITGPDVLGEILRRNEERAEMDRVARMLGFPRRRSAIKSQRSASVTHRAQLGRCEHVESNLPLRS